MAGPEHSAHRTAPVESRPATALLLIATLGSALAGCGSRGSASAAVRGLVDREVKAINAEDLKALSDIWAQDDAILMLDVPPPGRFQGWDRIGRQWKDFFERFSELHLAVDSLQVEVEGNLAYATYDWALSGTMGEHVLKDRGQATEIYRKRDGQWRLVHAHYSPALAAEEIPAAQATASPAPAAPPPTAPAPPAPASTPPPEKPR